MANTKRLLDPQGLDDLLKEVRIEQDVFEGDDQRKIQYNRLVLEFDNGDELYIKCTPEIKQAIFYARLLAAK